jgi:hypothetical protein
MARFTGLNVSRLRAASLAVQVEDHDLEFGQFEGTIPQREYGAGSITIWDHGTYELEERTNDRIAFVLHGSRLTGAYYMVCFKRAGRAGLAINEAAGPGLIVLALSEDSSAAEVVLRVRICVSRNNNYQRNFEPRDFDLSAFAFRDLISPSCLRRKMGRHGGHPSLE